MSEDEIIDSIWVTEGAVGCSVCGIAKPPSLELSTLHEDWHRKHNELPTEEEPDA
jgi:hypothetical protein